MSTVEEIQNAIRSLPSEQYSELIQWLVSRKAKSPKSDEMADDVFDQALESVMEDYAPLLEALSK